MAVVALLLMSAFTMSKSSNAKLEMKNGNIYISTNLKGEAGFKACDDERETVDAYVFTLYQKVFDRHISNGGTTKENAAISCLAQKGRWVQIAKESGNAPLYVFKNMAQGEYKAIVLSGQAIGCEIIGDTKEFPTKSIVYEQRKTTRQVLRTPTINTSDNINAAIKNNGLSVFPNPTSNELFIQVNDSDFKHAANITIYDMTGKVIMQTTKSIEDIKFHEWKFNVGSFADGAYLLRVSNENGIDYQEKFIVNSTK